MSKHKLKEFKPTSWSIDNKTSIFVLAVIISIFGIMNYNSIPKEQFPDIVFPKILVNTIYPGTSPSDMESLVTRPLEKNLKSINGVKIIESNSVQDYSVIIIDFNTDVDVAQAKQKVKDAVDKTKKDLPNNLPTDPMVMEIDLSEIPIMNINLSGNLDLNKLKKFGEMAQDRIESMKEITRVDIVGALDREIQLDVDMYKMQSASVTFNDIERAVAYENMTVAGGTIDLQGMRRSIRVVGDFKDIETIRNIQLHSSSGATVRLTDIAIVTDGYKERESYARLDGQNVITLNVIKKSGQNLLEASDKIKDILAELQQDKFPPGVKVTITADMSKFTRSTLHELNNTIIIGFILVTIVLMFFMGLTNAIFVGFSVPLSMALCYIVMPGLGYTMNMLVMFSFIFALGIVVDDAIVVIENTHRIFKQYKGTLNIVESAKIAAGEVFVPILSGTLTTLAPFFPLVFWPGITGKFMHFIPVVIILTLTASLIVAYIINPVFAVAFMKHDDHHENKKDYKKIFKYVGILLASSVVFHLLRIPFMGNLMIFMVFIYFFHMTVGRTLIFKFQDNFLPRLLKKYEQFLLWTLQGIRPYMLVVGMVLLFIGTIVLTKVAGIKVGFFPKSEPQYIYTFVDMPVGTDVKVTDSITGIVEQRINKALGIDPATNKKNPVVESVITNIALGASEDAFSTSTTSNKGKVTVVFVEYAKRKGTKSSDYLNVIRNAVKNIPGAKITVAQNQMGPPSSGKPINIEISGENIEELIATTDAFKKFIESKNIEGIEQLKSNFSNNKPEIIINIDRTRANRDGISTAQIGMEIRTAILGKEISKYRELEEQYPIQLRYNKNIRNNVDKLLNLKIVYRDMNTGLLRQIPLATVAKIDYLNTYGGIKRKNVKRVITLSSNVVSGYNATEINSQIQRAIPEFRKKESVEIKLTGESEDQKEAAAFLGKAMLLSLFLILFIMITQFNSLSKPIIILTSVFFSIMGVLLGYIIFRQEMSIVMTGMGIVALAGIVVRNGILLVEFTDVLKERGLKTRDAIIMGGKTRITPVLLTATATMLGLVPLAIGFNINFETLILDFNPQIYFGGDNMQFFGAMANTIIYGLSFATFLTLILIPAMYYIAYVGKVKSKRRRSNRLYYSGKQGKFLI